MAKKKKAVFTADPHQLEDIQAVVSSGRYRSASEFLREAVDEKLARLRAELLAEQIARYSIKETDAEGVERNALIQSQAFDAK